MNLLPFVRRLFSALSTKRKKCQRRLGVEPLEDRTLLAAFEVVTAGDTPAGSCTGAACTLRDAVNAANATAGADEISFNGSFGDANPGDENYSITLASELAVTESLTINGFASAAVSISGNDATRLFNFEGGGANTYVLNNLTLAQGNSAGARTGFGGAVVMVDADDTLTINDSVIRDSAATSGGGTSGGGIYVQAGTFNLNRSAVINNSASFGGGLEFRNATATLTNVTVSGNQASSNLGGGISHGANGTGATSQLTIRNSTIAGNSSPGGANLDNTTEGGATSSVVTYQNTIFAQPLGGGVNVRNLDIAGTGATATSLGDNISDDTTGNLIAAGDLPNTNALLGPLANNGSNLPTHAPLTGSPAINAGANLSGVGVTTDQRGVARPQFGFFDIGAHEVGFDFGDAPAPYPTLLLDGGARHFDVGPTLGANRDSEADGQPAALADGDDLNVVPDDEDGVTFINNGLLVAGARSWVDVNLQNANGTANILDAWIDWNGDGDWSDPGEQIFTNLSLGTANGVQRLTFTVPANAATFTQLFARFRLGTSSVGSPIGIASDGEVEDHPIEVFPESLVDRDFGDAPDGSVGTGTGNYQTLLNDNGARHHIPFTNNVFLGTAVDFETDGQPNGTATGDDIVTSPNDEDGVTSGVLIPGGNVNLTVTATGGGGFLNAWFDCNRDGDFNDANEQFFTDQVLTVGANPFVVAVPAGASTGVTYVRFRYSTVAGLTPTGLAADGEVEDHRVEIGLPAPDQIGVARGDQVFRDANGNGVYNAPPTGDFFHSFGATTDRIIIGDWDGNGIDDLGAERNQGATKYLFRDLNGNGSFELGTDGFTSFGNATDELILGDWDGDGDDDIGVTRANGGNKQFFRDRNGNGLFDTGIDSISFFGLATDETILGDWNGDGSDDIGVTRANGGNKQFFRDLNGNGNFDNGTDAISFFGLGTDETIVGDWNGDGTDDVGVTRANGGNKQFFRDLNGNGGFENGIDAFTFFGISTDETILGDWDGDGDDDVGVTRSSGGNKQFFRDLNGNASYNHGVDAFTSFGIASDVVIVGVWSLPLMASAGVAANPVDDAPLTAAQLQPIVSAAIDLLAATGLGAEQLAALNQVEVYVADLSGARLGQAAGQTITLDINAAGHGWFIDTTPADHEEFSLATGDTLLATGDSAANGRLDLLTAVLHELGHLLGHTDLTSDLDADDLMYGTLAAGQRKLPTSSLD